MKNRSWKNFLQYPGIQIQYAFKVALLILLVSGSFVFYIQNQYQKLNNSITQTLEQREKLIEAIMLLPEAQNQLEKYNTESQKIQDLKTKQQKITGKILWTHWSMVFILTILSFLATIITTHKLAGPLRIIEETISKMVNNQELSFRKLRKKDHFQEIHQNLNKLNNKMKEKKQEGPE